MYLSLSLFEEEEDKARRVRKNSNRKDLLFPGENFKKKREFSSSLCLSLSLYHTHTQNTQKYALLLSSLYLSLCRRRQQQQHARAHDAYFCIVVFSQQPLFKK
jgi:hypothetical protein